MEISEQNIKKLGSLLSLINEDKLTLTKEEFLKSFQNVVNLVLKIEKSLVEKHDKNIADMKELFEMLKSQTGKAVSEDTSTAIKQLTGKIEKSLREQESGMKFIYDKVKKIKEGKDGKDADIDKIIKEVLAKISIPKIEKMTAEQLRDSLEELSGDERIDWKSIRGLEEALKDTRVGTGMAIFGGNRPLQIQEAGTVKDKATRFLNFTGASISRSANGVTTIAISGGGVETPSGTMNSANKTFTVLHTPLWINWQGQMLYSGSGYSLAGLTLTLDEAPDSGDALLSHF